MFIFKKIKQLLCPECGAISGGAHADWCKNK